MKNWKLYFITMCVCFFTAQLFPQSVNFNVTVTESPTPISPYIYGANPGFTSDENLTARRLGGNRLTGYNWENNASHAGKDWYHFNDNYLAAGLPNPNDPGAVLAAFHEEALNVGAYSLVTLQMAGYVSKDKNGDSVTLAQTAPSSRFVEVQFAKGSAFSYPPDLSDNYVYMDECVDYLVEAYGMANTDYGVKGYALDNEPALWYDTHPRIHPNKATCQEVKQKAIDLSTAVKNVDPYAEIFGPVLYGFGAYYDFQTATDWSTVRAGKGYSWFIDYYLDEMRKADSTYGRRLVDVLDLHWYPEAQGDNRISETWANTAKDKLARVQAPRSLWDPAYGYSATDPTVGEKSWIAQSFRSYIPLIPKIKSSINKFYPGTKLAFTEFTYGGETDITGGIATADALGIFGKYGIYFATFWPNNSGTSYVRAAYRIFRNYDGFYSTFGDAYIPTTTSDSIHYSIYASVLTGTNEIHLIAINKNLSSASTAIFTISGSRTITSGNAWILDSTGAAIRNAGSIGSIASNSFSYTLPAGSVCHFVLDSYTYVNPGNSNLIPSKLTLNAYPNPFNSSCKIEYNVPDNSVYRLEIFDMLGRLVKKYNYLPKSGFVTWDGTNGSNQTVASGVYCVSIRGENLQTLSKRIILMK